MNNVMNDIGDLQTNYQVLIDEKRISKKAMCDLVIPFRDISTDLPICRHYRLQGTN